MKLSNLSPEEWFKRLSARRDENKTRVNELWPYYEGTQPMNWVARILAEQDNRFPMLTINCRRKYVRSGDRRSILEGCGYAGEDSFDDDMQRIMRRNELDLHNSVNNIATLVTGVSYGMVSPRESDGAAVITIEDPASMAVERDPVTGEVIAAIKFWSSDPDKDDEDQSILHLPGKSGGSQLIR